MTCTDLNLDTVTVTLADRVATVTLNRPQALNAFAPALIDDLTDAFLAVAADPTARVLVLTGAGRAFSAGADLKQFGAPATPPRHGFAGLLDAIIDFPKPFFAMVNGIGVGLGATLCGLADFVFMAESARLRCPFSTLGVTAEGCSTYLFPQLMGRQRAMWFLMSAEWMSAAECVDAGLALAAVPDADLAATVQARARTLAGMPLVSLVTTKKLMTDPHRETLRRVARAEIEALGRLAGGPANREAISAFREQRPADFSGIE